MNYGELQTAILDYAHRGDLAAEVPGFIRLTEGMIARELRSTEQTTTATLAEADRVSGGIYTLPAGVLEVRAVYYPAGGRQALEQVSLAQIRGRASSAPVAQYAMRGGAQIELRGAPPEDADFSIDYIGRLVALANPSDTNDLLTNHEALYLYGGLFHLYQYTQDLELATAALDTFLGALEKLNEQAGRKLGGASIAPGYNLYGAGGGY